MKKVLKLIISVFIVCISFICVGCSDDKTEPIYLNMSELIQNSLTTSISPNNKKRDVYLSAYGLPAQYVKYFNLEIYFYKNVDGNLENTLQTFYYDLDNISGDFILPKNIIYITTLPKNTFCYVSFRTKYELYYHNLERTEFEFINYYDEGNEIELKNNKTFAIVAYDGIRALDNQDEISLDVNMTNSMFSLFKIDRVNLYNGHYTYIFYLTYIGENKKVNIADISFALPNDVN